MQPQTWDTFTKTIWRTSSYCPQVCKLSSTYCSLSMRWS